MNDSSGLLRREVSRKAMFVIMLLCLVLLLVPMLYIARCAIPSSDDFAYGVSTHEAFMEEGTLTAVISAAYRLTENAYYTWQGTFSAVFLMSMQPAIYGEQFYPLTTVIMLSSLLGGIFFLCYSVFGKVFGADKYSAGMIAVAVSILCTQFLPVPNEAFYWYNGSMFYTFFFGLTLVAYGALIRYIMAKKRKIAAGAGMALLFAFLGGANYVCSLLTAELLFTLTVFLAHNKNGRWKDALIFFSFFMASFLINALAPGNAVRQASFTERLSLVSTILTCFKTAASTSLHWFTLPMAAMLVFLVPVSGAICLRTEFRFGHPVLVSLFSFCLLSSMYCPGIFAMGLMGTVPAGRIRDIIFFTYVLFAVGNVFYWTGWFLRRYEKLQREPKGIKVWFIAAVLLLFAGGTALIVRQQNVTSAYAAVSILNGGADNYYETAQARFEQLKDDSIKELEFQPFSYVPSVIFHSDVSDDPGEARNIYMSRFYNKDKIWLSEPFNNYFE